MTDADNKAQMVAEQRRLEHKIKTLRLSLRKAARAHVEIERRVDELVACVFNVTGIMEFRKLRQDFGDPHAKALGKRGGQARAAKLTRAERSESARLAVNARWEKERTKKRKNPAAVSLGRNGGKRGGLAKVPKGFSKMTPARRREIALAGVAARRAKKAREAAEALAEGNSNTP